MTSTPKTIWHNKIDSTNNEAKRYLSGHNELPVIIAANTQTNGRGQFERSWISEKGGAYFSIICKPRTSALKDISYFQQLIANKLIFCLHTLTNKEYQLEWPNDIILNHKKVGGILVETSSQGNATESNPVIIGIGINVNQKTFPDDLQFTATSLFKETNQEYDITALIRQLSKEITNVL